MAIKIFYGRLERQEDSINQGVSRVVEQERMKSEGMCTSARDDVIYKGFDCTTFDFDPEVLINIQVLTDKVKEQAVTKGFSVVSKYKRYADKLVRYVKYVCSSLNSVG